MVTAAVSSLKKHSMTKAVCEIMIIDTEMYSLWRRPHGRRQSKGKGGDNFCLSDVCLYWEPAEELHGKDNGLLRFTFLLYKPDTLETASEVKSQRIASEGRQQAGGPESTGSEVRGPRFISHYSPAPPWLTVAICMLGTKTVPASEGLL